MNAAAVLLHAHVADAIAAPTAPIPLLVGGCGSGRTTALLELGRDLGSARAQYVDVERVATTPERFLRALVARSPFHVDASRLPGPDARPRDAWDAALAFLATARGRDGSPAIFLLDEVLEVKTFESFPGLRAAVGELVDAMANSPNRFVLTSRFTTRARRLLNGHASRLRLVAAPEIALESVADACRAQFPVRALVDLDDTARTIRGLANGQALYARAIVEQMAALSATGAADPISALAVLLAPEGRLAVACRFVYEFRLHRARGYGALKGILDVLAEEEPLTLTEIAQRLHRTPGSTKDYLSWLEDVDLIVVARKRYRVADPMLRLWIRLYSQPVPPGEDDVVREVHRYVAARLPEQAEAVGAAAGRDRRSDIIEFD